MACCRVHNDLKLQVSLKEGQSIVKKENLNDSGPASVALGQSVALDELVVLYADVREKLRTSVGL